MGAGDSKSNKFDLVAAKLRDIWRTDKDIEHWQIDEYINLDPNKWPAEVWQHLGYTSAEDMLRIMLRTLGETNTAFNTRLLQYINKAASAYYSCVLGDKIKTRAVRNMQQRVDMHLGMYLSTLKRAVEFIKSHKNSATNVDYDKLSIFDSNIEEFKNAIATDNNKVNDSMVYLQNVLKNENNDFISNEPCDYDDAPKDPEINSGKIYTLRSSSTVNGVMGEILTDIELAKNAFWLLYDKNSSMLDKIGKHDRICKEDVLAIHDKEMEELKTLYLKDVKVLGGYGGGADIGQLLITSIIIALILFLLAYLIYTVWTYLEIVENDTCDVHWEPM